MTLREKLELEHPECIGDIWYGGCKDCPHQYGYEACKEGECDSKTVNDEICRKCWDRKYEGELTPQEKKIESLRRDLRSARSDKECFIREHMDLRKQFDDVRNYIKCKTGKYLWYDDIIGVKDVLDNVLLSRNRWRDCWFGMLIGNILAFILGFFI